MVNQASGAAVIAPWQVGQLPGVWLDAFQVFLSDQRDLQRNLTEFNQFVANWRQRAMSRRM